MDEVMMRCIRFKDKNQTAKSHQSPQTVILGAWTPYRERPRESVKPPAWTSTLTAHCVIVNLTMCDCGAIELSTDQSIRFLVYPHTVMLQSYRDIYNNSR